MDFNSIVPPAYRSSFSPSARDKRGFSEHVRGGLLNDALKRAGGKNNFIILWLEQKGMGFLSALKDNENIKKPRQRVTQKGELILFEG